MKRGTFRKVEFTIELTHSYGHYLLSARYRGKDIHVLTTNSEAYDWIDDESRTDKHNEALRYCYSILKRTYNEQI